MTRLFRYCLNSKIIDRKARILVIVRCLIYSRTLFKNHTYSHFVRLYDAGKSNVFFQRQFAQCVKLLRNVLKWQGIINEEILTDIANSSLLNRYLLMGIRTLQPLEAASKCLMVNVVCPR